MYAKLWVSPKHYSFLFYPVSQLAFCSELYDWISRSDPVVVVVFFLIKQVSISETS